MNWPTCKVAPNPHNVPFKVQVEHSVRWLKDMHLMDLNDDLMARNIYTPYTKFLYGIMHQHPAKRPLIAEYKRQRNLMEGWS